MRRVAVVGVLALLVSTGLPAVAQEQLFAQLLKGPGALASLAQEIGMKISGARMCRIQYLLPAADIATIVAAMRKVDSAGVDAAFLKADLITRGIELVPGTEPCRFVAKNIEEARPLYATIAGAIRK